MARTHVQYKQERTISTSTRTYVCVLLIMQSHRSPFGRSLHGAGAGAGVAAGWLPGANSHCYCCHQLAAYCCCCCWCCASTLLPPTPCHPEPCCLPLGTRPASAILRSNSHKSDGESWTWRIISTAVEQDIGRWICAAAKVEF